MARLAFKSGPSSTSLAKRLVLNLHAEACVRLTEGSRPWAWHLSSRYKVRLAVLNEAWGGNPQTKTQEVAFQIRLRTPTRLKISSTTLGPIKWRTTTRLKKQLHYFGVPLGCPYKSEPYSVTPMLGDPPVVLDLLEPPKVSL